MNGDPTSTAQFPNRFAASVSQPVKRRMSHEANSLRGIAHDVVTRAVSSSRYMNSSKPPPQNHLSAASALYATP